MTRCSKFIQIYWVLLSFIRLYCFIKIVLSCFFLVQLGITEVGRILNGLYCFSAAGKKKKFRSFRGPCLLIAIETESRRCLSLSLLVQSKRGRTTSRSLLPIRNPKGEKKKQSTSRGFTCTAWSVVDGAVTSAGRVSRFSFFFPAGP